MDPSDSRGAPRLRSGRQAVGVLGATVLAFVLLHAGVATAGTLFIALPEKADPCDFEQIASALRTRVPGAVIVLGLGEDRPGDVAIGFDRGSDTWTLTLTAVGSNPLKREIPAPTSECLAFAETSALIVERYLESIAWTAAPALVSPLPPPPPRIPWNFIAALGAGGYLGQPGAAPDGDFELGVRHGRWQLTADLAAPLLGPFLETRASMSRALGIRTRRVSSRCGYL